jgi:hypothetical protein
MMQQKIGNQGPNTTIACSFIRYKKIEMEEMGDLLAKTSPNKT